MNHKVGVLLQLNQKFQAGVFHFDENGAWKMEGNPKSLIWEPAREQDLVVLLETKPRTIYREFPKVSWASCYKVLLGDRILYARADLLSIPPEKEND